MVVGTEVLFPDQAAVRYHHGNRTDCQTTKPSTPCPWTAPPPKSLLHNLPRVLASVTCAQALAWLGRGTLQWGIASAWPACATPADISSLPIDEAALAEYEWCHPGKVGLGCVREAAEWKGWSWSLQFLPWFPDDEQQGKMDLLPPKIALGHGVDHTTRKQSGKDPGSAVLLWYHQTIRHMARI